MQKPITLYQPQKLHVIALVIILLKALKQAWALLFVFTLQLLFNNNSKEKKPNKATYIFIGGIVILIVLKIGALIKYFTTKYYVNSQNELVSITGWLNKKTTLIPLSKIQSLQSSQHFLNRISNTYAVQIETAGSTTTELSLAAISFQQFNELKDWLELSEDSIKAIEQDKEEDTFSAKTTILKLSFSDFLKLCISENHLKTLGIILAFLFGKLQDVKDVFGIKTEEAIDAGLNSAYNANKNILILIIAVLLVTIVVSSIRIVLRYYNFSLEADKVKLFLKWGLINTQQKTVLREKIQMLSYCSNLVRTWLKLAELRIYTLGEDINKTQTHITLPITNSHQKQVIINQYAPNLVFNSSDFLAIQKGYVWNRLMLIGLPMYALLWLGILKFSLLSTSIVTTSWLLLYTIHIIVFAKKFKAFVSEDCLKIKQGIWGKKVFILKWENIQFVTLQTSPFQRRKNLASLEIGTTDKKLEIPFIGQKQATFLYNYSLYKIETLVQEKNTKN